MELRWILLIAAIIIGALIAWHTSRSSFVSALGRLKYLFKRENQMDLFGDEKEPEYPQDVETPEGLICLHIKSKPGKSFGGQQLLVHLNRAGLHFGDMSIFHYTPENAEKPIFSLASAFEPGTFDIDRMDHFETEGLSLFMQTDSLVQPEESLDTLFDIADELAERLDGDLLDHRWHLLSDGQIDAYYNSLN
jgi:cell division protein ZipA